MRFSRGNEVIYRQMNGVIDFVCDDYVVVEIPSDRDRNPARLLVLRHNYEQLQISKASMK